MEILNYEKILNVFFVKIFRRALKKEVYMSREPTLNDEIYVEIRECEPYALLNLITFELTIRNKEVKDILEKLKSIPSNDCIYLYSECVKLIERLKEEYFFDYRSYRRYVDTRQENKIIHIKHNGDNLYTHHLPVPLYRYNHNSDNSYTHHLSLPLSRPLALISKKNSYIQIRIPIYHIHPKDIKDYYMKAFEEHKKVATEAKIYYKHIELFYDEVDETKSKASTFATMFFVWDYIEWLKETKELKKGKTLRTHYSEISELINAKVEDTTGRSPTVEKYLEIMTRLIDKSEYKNFYTLS